MRQARQQEVARSAMTPSARSADFSVPSIQNPGDDDLPVRALLRFKNFGYVEAVRAIFTCTK